MVTSWLVDIMAFATALAVSVIATPIIRSAAVRWRLGNKPNGRSLHTHLIPHLGGIALLLGVAGGLAFAVARDGTVGQGAALIARAVPAMLVVVALGLVDDMRNLAARQKLVVQVLAASMLVAVGFRLFTGVWAFDASSLVVTGVSLFFFVIMLSSVNLIDGHDGLAAGVVLLSAASFAVIARMVGAPEVGAVTLAVCGACLGFLVFNFPPGRIYMGDTGSMLLGVLLALAACLVTMHSPSVDTFAAVCFALGLPLLDTALAIARRIVLRSPLFAADNLHMHHVLRGLGFSARRTLFILYGMQALFSGVAVAAAAGWVLPVIVGLGFVAVAFVSFLRAMVEGRNVSQTMARHLAAKTIPFQPSFTNNLQERRTSVGR